MRVQPKRPRGHDEHDMKSRVTIGWRLARWSEGNKEDMAIKRTHNPTMVPDDPKVVRITITSLRYKGQQSSPNFSHRIHPSFVMSFSIISTFLLKPSHRERRAGGKVFHMINQVLLFSN